MQTKIILWEVIPQDTPAIIRRCSKCGAGSRFCSSGNFRINANQRSLDVWLIYRCETCDTTLNLTLYSRVSPATLDPDEYERMLANDKQLAQSYAFNRHILKRNQMEADFPSVRFDVTGENITAGMLARIHIHSPFPTDQRIPKLIAGKFLLGEPPLPLSREQCKRLCRAGLVTGSDGADIQKAKLNGDFILRADLTAIPPIISSTIPSIQTNNFLKSF